MKIPGVASVVAGVTGGAAQVVRAGVASAAGAAGAVQLLASPVAELAGPVVQSVANSTGRALGMSNSPDGSREPITPTVRWQSGQRVHLDLDPLLPFPRWHEYAAVVEEPIRRIPGVAKAHIEGSLGRLVVELEEDADNAAVLDEVREEVVAIAADLAATGPGSAPDSAPFADPGNPLAILVPMTAAAMDVVAIGAAVTGWFTRLPMAPKSARAAAALLKSPTADGVGPGVATGSGRHRPRARRYHRNGLRSDPITGTPLLDLAQRGLEISEAAAYRQRWRSREPELASPNRPQAPVVPVISSAASSQAPRHDRWSRRRARLRTLWSMGRLTARSIPARARWQVRLRNTSVQAANGVVDRRGQCVAGRRRARRPRRRSLPACRGQRIWAGRRSPRCWAVAWRMPGNSSSTPALCAAWIGCRWSSSTALRCAVITAPSCIRPRRRTRLGRRPGI